MCARAVCRVQREGKSAKRKEVKQEKSPRVHVLQQQLFRGNLPRAFMRSNTDTPFSFQQSSLCVSRSLQQIRKQSIHPASACSSSPSSIFIHDPTRFSSIGWKHYSVGMTLIRTKSCIPGNGTHSASIPASPAATQKASRWTRRIGSTIMARFGPSSIAPSSAVAINR